MGVELIAPDTVIYRYQPRCLGFLYGLESWYVSPVGESTGDKIACGCGGELVVRHLRREWGGGCHGSGDSACSQKT